MGNVSAPADQARLSDPGTDAVEDIRTFRVARFLALIPGLAIGLAMIWSSSVVQGGQRLFTLVDDSLISMSYARTLAQTGELVWFPDADRVEGFTNPGYTFLMTLPHLLGFDQSAASLTMSLFGLFTVLWSAFLAGGLAMVFSRSRATAMTTTFAVSVLFPLLYWAIFGLEVGLIAALALLLLAMAHSGAVRGFPLATVVIMAGISALGILVRPDFAVAAVVVAAWVVWCRVELPQTNRVTRALVLGAGILGSLVVITAARLAYYGAATPNTYDLKVGNSTLAQRVLRAWSVDPEALWLIGLGLLAVVVLYLLLDPARDSFLWPVALVGLSQIVYSFYVGGDTFHPNRFLVLATITVLILLIPAMMLLPRNGWPAAAAAVMAAVVAAVVLWRTLPGTWALFALLPPVLLVVGIAIGNPTERWRRVVPGLPVAAACVAVIALTAGNAVAGYRGWWEDRAALWPLDRIALAQAARAASVSEPEAVFGVFGAGAIPYWGQRPAVDLLGKSDRLVARQERRNVFIPGHDKWDYTHSILGLRPDLVDADLLNPADYVAQTFPPRGDERQQMAALYDRMCYPDGIAVMVRKDTDRIDRSQFVACPLPDATP